MKKLKLCVDWVNKTRLQKKKKKKNSWYYFGERNFFHQNSLVR